MNMPGAAQAIGALAMMSDTDLAAIAADTLANMPADHLAQLDRVLRAVAHARGLEVRDGRQPVVTDEERLVALLESFGITPDRASEHRLWLYPGDPHVDGSTDRHIGCLFEFDADGAFVQTGVWE